MNPIYIVIPLFVVLLGIILTTNNYSALEFLMLFFFIVIIAIIGTNYFFGIQLTATLNNLFSKPKVNVDIVEPTESESQTSQSGQSDKPETYHIQGQFDYSTAKSVCKAYGATLATLDQVKESYQKGGEWCDYGWSDDQMVLYPTQESSWQKYQETDKKQCGIPGINGGYNVHENQKLGVNCFGKKPIGKMPDTPVEPTKIDAVVKQISDVEGIKEVKNDSKLTIDVYNNLNRVLTGILLFSVLFLIVAMVLINNSIRLKIFSKRFIIKTMQLVGAKRRFILKPFIKEAIILGIIGAAIGLIALFTGWYFFTKFIDYTFIVDQSKYVWLVIIVVSIGILITTISTIFATWRFLASSVDDLYYS